MMTRQPLQPRRPRSRSPIYYPTEEILDASAKIQGTDQHLAVGTHVVRDPVHRLEVAPLLQATGFPLNAAKRAEIIIYRGISEGFWVVKILSCRVSKRQIAQRLILQFLQSGFFKQQLRSATPGDYGIITPSAKYHNIERPVLPDGCWWEASADLDIAVLPAAVLPLFVEIVFLVYKDKPEPPPRESLDFVSAQISCPFCGEIIAPGGILLSIRRRFDGWVVSVHLECLFKESFQSFSQKFEPCRGLAIEVATWPGWTAEERRQYAQALESIRTVCKKTLLSYLSGLYPRPWKKIHQRFLDAYVPYREQWATVLPEPPSITTPTPEGPTAPESDEKL